MFTKPVQVLKDGSLIKKFNTNKKALPLLRLAFFEGSNLEFIN